MNCPKCTTPLESAKQADLNLTADHCSKCGGSWLDYSDLKRMVRLHSSLGMSKPEKLKALAPTQRKCPHCASFLSTGVTPELNVQVELCTQCKGYWIDSGELKVLQAK